MDIMKRNNIDCFDINDGAIMYKKKSSKQPITKKVLLSLLGTFFNGDLSKAEEVKTFIMENREQKITECIVRKTDSSK
jgi:hypothetical protein